MLKPNDVINYRLYNSVDRRSYGPVETGRIEEVHKTYSPTLLGFETMYTVRNTLTNLPITLHRREIIGKARQ